MDLCELLDQLFVRELSVLADEFGIFGGIRNRRIAPWASWWQWRIRQALEEPDELQPEGLSTSELRDAELDALSRDFLALAERHADEPGLLQFGTGTVTQMQLTLLEREAEREELRATIAQSRELIDRERAEGKRPSVLFRDGVR
jgi:hypothetical protein